VIPARLALPPDADGQPLTQGGDQLPVEQAHQEPHA
jgi:hypothetical protein